MSDQSGFSNVATPPQTPTLPTNPLPIVFSGFDTLNTKPSQQGIEDQQMFICDGFMPLGKNNLRSLRGLGTPIYTTPGGTVNASGNIAFSVNPSNGDTITLDSVVWTFVTAGASGNETNIGANLGATLTSLVAQLNASTNTFLKTAGYTTDANGTNPAHLIIRYNTVGAVGNSYTLAASAATPSGMTLSGGTPAIKNFNFNNIGSVPYCIICLDDGSLVAVNLDTLVATPLFQGFATGSILFSANPTNGDTITLNGVVWTFVSGSPTGNEFSIGVNLGGTLTLAQAVLSASVNPLIDVATYTENGSGTNPASLFVTYKTAGTAGNAYTLAASAATPSGAHLTGGSIGAGIITSFPPDYSQWAGLYIIIVAPQTNGYFLWDGTNLFLAGSLAPQVTVTNSGLNYTSPPTITVSGGNGSGATFSSTIINGSIANITVTKPGSGYLVTDDIILNISGGGSDTMASADAVITSSDRGIVGVTITTGGSGYSGLAYVQASATGTLAATFALTGQNGTITGVTVLNPGIGYAGTETLSVVDPASTPGTGANILPIFSAGQITSATITNAGTNYTTPPTITVVGDGTGAVLEALLSGSVVDSINVVSGGAGYTQALLDFSGGNNGASATATIMPFGVSGSTVETYSGRVWVGNGRNGQYSAPGNPADFNAQDGAGAFQSTDSFLRIEYVQFSQSNGFLYLFADSSLNYVSGVVTSGSPPATTFNNLNVDPQVGTPWHGTVQSFGRDLIFANPVGVFVSYGGAVTKVSDALDGIFATVPQTDWASGFEPSAAVMTIFGIRVYILLLPIIDQVSGQQVYKFLMWDSKRWFTSPQEGLTNNALPFIASQDFNSVLTAYCSPDQSTISPMFTNLSEQFERYLYSKLWSAPGIFLRKIQREQFVLANVNYLDPHQAASGSLAFSVNPSNGDTITLNGVVWTFVSGVASGNQISIAANLGGTLTFAVAALTSSGNPLIDVATYTDNGSGTNPASLFITYKTTGTIGNTYTLSASVAQPSGLTLTGGIDGPSLFVATITENGVDTTTEVEVIPTATGPEIFGPLPGAVQGRLTGVRIKTMMADIQLNEITLINNLGQSDV